MTQNYVEGLIAKLGETAMVGVIGRGTAWHVPRHYIALHGIKAVELPVLAEKYNWKAVTNDRT